MKRATGLFAAAALIALAGGLRADDVELGGLKSKAPEEWKAQEIPDALKQFRIYQAKLPKADGDAEDAELIIFYFGEGGGGGVEANVKRWKEMFAPPQGKNIDDVAKVEEVKVGNHKATVLEVTGTYKFKARPFDPKAEVTEKPNFKLVGAVFEAPKGPYFIRVTGPAKTMEKHKKGLDEWVKNFK